MSKIKLNPDGTIKQKHRNIDTVTMTSTCTVGDDFIPQEIPKRDKLKEFIEFSNGLLALVFITLAYVGAMYIHRLGSLLFFMILLADYLIGKWKLCK